MAHQPMVHLFRVVAALPPELEGLRELAYNLQWSWDPEATDLLRRLDRSRWEAVQYNPILLLSTLPMARLRAKAAANSVPRGGYGRPMRACFSSQLRK